MVDYDLTTANSMLKTGRYVYVIFMCHLAIEKAFKALICNKNKQIPPKTHDLIYLLKLTNIQLPEKLMDFLGMINNVSVVTRYPEDFPKLIQSYPKKIAKQYLDKTREIIQCLRKDNT